MKSDGNTHLLWAAGFKTQFTFQKLLCLSKYALLRMTENHYEQDICHISVRHEWVQGKSDIT